MLFLMFSFVSPVAHSQNQKISLHDIWIAQKFKPNRIESIRSTKDGEHYCVLTRSGIDMYEYATGALVKNVCLFNGPAMAHKAKPLPRIEEYEFDNDEKQILLSAGFEPIYRHSGVSDYYLYSVEEGSFVKLSNNGKQRLTTFSPDGKKVAFVRDNNLYYMDLASLEEHQITFDGAFNKVINGTTDWVYEEEFAITEGFKWSPDSKRIAFYRFDESRVKQYGMQMWGELYPENYSYKYPKAGEENSKVEVYIYNLEDGRTLKPALGSENDQYLPRFQWTKNSNLLSVMRMNRLQNKMELLLVDANTLEVSPLYTEENDTYVEVPDTWQFLNDGKNFLITSEKDGFRHIYMYNLQGKEVAQITKGNFEVERVCGVDETKGRIYFTSHESAPINTDLYVVDFKGKKKTCLNTNGRLGTYDPYFSTGCKYYIAMFSDANSAPVYTLHNSNGKLLKTLEDNAELQRRMSEYGTARKTFGTFTTSIGTELNYYLILPEDFDSTKQYPLFFYVYGGPGNQQVNNAFGYSDYFWFHMLSQHGYAVVCFDGRGTGGRGADFKKQTYRNLGKMECEDAIEAARYFGAKQWVDESRIGIFGWSFGGYLSSLSILKGNDVFKSAIAVAPVITWRYYDDIYTERFLQRPQDNPNGYDDNSPLNFVNLLKGNYLLVHGTGDDNVHFQNSAAMVEALEKAGKTFEMRIYPNKNHSILGASTRLNLYELMTDFIYRKL